MPGALRMPEMPDQVGNDGRSGMMAGPRRRGGAGLLPRMVGEDGGLPGGSVDVGVDFGGEDGFVAEHFLDDAMVINNRRQGDSCRLLCV